MLLKKQDIFAQRKVEEAWETSNQGFHQIKCVKKCFSHEIANFVKNCTAQAFKSQIRQNELSIFKILRENFGDIILIQFA